MTIESIIIICAFLLLFIAACIALIRQKSKRRTSAWQVEEEDNGKQPYQKNITSQHHEKATVQLKVYSNKNKKTPSFFRRGSRQNGQ